MTYLFWSPASLTCDQIYPPPPNFEGNADEWITGWAVDEESK